MISIPLVTGGSQTGGLGLSHRVAERYGHLRRGEIRISRTPGPEHTGTADFIRDVYRKAYDARINPAYPALMSLLDGTGAIQAALGYRPAAAGERLFLESYTDERIETLLANAFGGPVARDQVVEVGNLASVGHGESVFLFYALNAYLHNEGYRHVVVTGTQSLIARFRKLGLAPKIIAAADPARLADGGASWGRYYATKPCIVAGELAEITRTLRNRLQGISYGCRRAPQRPANDDARPRPPFHPALTAVMV